jgi:hypothetical protein
MLPFVGFDQLIAQGATLLDLLQRLRDARLFDGAKSGDINER